MMFTRVEGRSPYHTRYRSDDCYDQLIWEVGTPAAATYLFTSASGTYKKRSRDSALVADYVQVQVHNIIEPLPLIHVDSLAQ
jgi:hypothetical protein